LQIRQTASETITGLTYDTSSTTGNAITYTVAADAITALRDALGGTSSKTVENPLTRTETQQGNVGAGVTGPDLFAADSNGVAYTRTPSQVKQICCYNNFFDASFCSRVGTSLTQYICPVVCRFWTSFTSATTQLLEVSSHMELLVRDTI